MYSVEFLPSAVRAFADADRIMAKKLARCLEQLERDPRDHPNIKPLKGKFAGCLRFRVGDHRVVYRIHDDKRVVVVMFIVYRKDVYD